MVGLPLGYCIDSTEVTRSQYLAWVNASPSTANQPSGCSWNTSFAPNISVAQEIAWGLALQDPVTNVNWCDAYSYCVGLGKRLCGKIGGGPNGFNDYANAALSEWYAACTSNGTYGYPYGNTYNPTACNTADAGNGGIVTVGTMTGCHSDAAGYAGVYDLSGNVWEWEDSCSDATGGTDYCRFRGGSFDYGSADTCSAVTNNYRNYSDGAVGFRCCAP